MKERRLTDKTKIILGIGKFIGIIIGIVSLVLVFASWKSNIEHKVENNSEQIILNTEEIKIIVDQQHQQDGLFIEILTDLKWIRANLGEE